MRNVLLVTLAVALPATALVAEPDEGIVLVKDGSSDYAIILSNEAGPSEKWAARDLADHLKQMSGATLPIRGEGGALPDKAILIGDGRLVLALRVGVDHAKLGTDGFIIRSVGTRLIIAGGRKRGTMYGVYELLGRLGCRWWAPGASTIPTMKTIRVPDLQIEKVPVLEYRDMLYGDLWQGLAGEERWLEGRRWCARNRVHARYHEMPEELGPIAMDRAIAHGVMQYLPPGTHFSKHPEYYALIRGKRSIRQPCWTNQDAIKTVAQGAVKKLDENPDWRLVTIGQADNTTICECDGCRGLIKKHVANSAMVVHFINAVAEIVKQKHPDAWVNTNAYRWTQQAPSGIRCADNVMITIPPIACNYGHPLTEGYPEENAQYKRDLENWAKICRKIYVWDYTTNFVHYVMPWPNFHVIQPNIRFFVDHNVSGVFEQGSHTTNNGQFSKLCMWLSAQVMWDPDRDGSELIAKFCKGYYGPEAGPVILDYIAMLQEKVVKERIPIWATHRTHLSAPHLTAEMIAKAEQMFRKAEELANDDAEMLRRVQVAHIPVQYMLLRRSSTYWAPAKKLVPELDFAAVAEQFARVGRENGIKRAAEGDHAIELYDWAVDYAKVMEGGEDGLPSELRAADPGTYTFLQAAQFDKQVKFLTRAEGATDGWAQRIVTHGWSITNGFAAGKDFTVGKSYKLFIRLKGEIQEVAIGKAITCGIHNPGRPRTCSRAIGVEAMDGKWHTFEIGPWRPDKNGGAFYISFHPSNSGNFRNENGELLPALLDCIWLIEAGDDRGGG